MKKRLVPLLCLLLCAALLAGCQITPAPGSTADTTAPPETTAVPTTTTPTKEEVSVELVFALLDEAAETLNTNETVTLAVNSYLSTYVENMFQEDSGTLTVSDDLITIQGADDSPQWEELRYLVFLSLITERYPDYLITYGEVYGDGPEVSAARPDAFFFFSGFDDRGYETIQAFYADNVHHYVPSGFSKLSIWFGDAYITDSVEKECLYQIGDPGATYFQYLENK